MTRRGISSRYKAAVKETGLGPGPALWIDWVEWEGPLKTGQINRRSLESLARNDADLEDSLRAQKVLEQFRATSLSECVAGIRLRRSPRRHP